MNISSKAKRFIVGFPSVILSIVICGIGLWEEWENCSSIIRPLGHAGLFMTLFAAHVYGIETGSVTVAYMSAFYSIFIDMFQGFEAMLIISSIYIMAQHPSFPCLSLGYAFSTLDLHNFGLSYVDKFAFCGHATLFVTTGLLTQSTTFFLSITLSAGILIMFSSSPLSAILACIASICYFGSLYERSAVEKVPWTSRTIWQTKHGPVNVCILVLYAIALLWHGYMLHCQVSQFSMTLHALHVGGILAVCAFIYPQVSNKRFMVFKMLLTTAALADATLSLCELFRDNSRIFVYCLVFRAVCALSTSIVVIKVGQPTETELISFHHEPTVRTKLLRLIFPFTYIVYMFVTWEHYDMPLAFAGITHFCFIIGGMAIESIASNDLLFTRLTATMIVFHAVGAVLEAFKSQDRFKMMELIPTLLVLASLPRQSSSTRSVLAFDDRSTFLQL